MRPEGYTVGTEHPSARRPIQAGDLVINTSGWPGRLHVIDVDRASGVAECVGPASVKIRCRLRDLIRLDELPR